MLVAPLSASSALACTWTIGSLSTYMTWLPGVAYLLGDLIHVPGLAGPVPTSMNWLIHEYVPGRMTWMGSARTTEQKLGIRSNRLIG
jgi:hypothetical protein